MTTMNRQDEYLSALVDGETGRFETRRAIDTLLGDAPQRGLWERYHLIGDVLRQESQLADAEFARRVMAEVEADDIGSGVPPRRWTRPLLGLAMAASVAGAMVIGLQSVLGPGSGGNQALQQTAMDTSMFAPMAASDPGHHVPTQLESYMRMNRYLLSHVEQSDAHGLLPYARMVSYTPDNS